MRGITRNDLNYLFNRHHVVERGSSLGAALQQVPGHCLIYWVLCQCNQPLNLPVA